MQSSFFPCKRYLFDGTALLDKKKKMGTQKGAVHKIRWQYYLGEREGVRIITREQNNSVYLLLIKVRQIQNDFLKPAFLRKNKRTNSTLLLVDLFSFVFWKKVETAKKTFRN